MNAQGASALLIKILLMPVLLAYTVAFALACSRLPLDPTRSFSILSAGIGFSSGLIIFAMISPVMRAYVVGHELSHWLVAKLFGRRTGEFKAECMQYFDSFV